VSRRSKQQFLVFRIAISIKLIIDLEKTEIINCSLAGKGSESSSMSCPPLLYRCCNATLSLLVSLLSAMNDFPVYLRSRCAKLLDSLIHHRASRGIFTHEINIDKPEEEYYAAKYIETVGAKPIHLAKIKQQIKLDNYYSNVQQLIKDIRLVYSNAMKYNPPHHFIHSLAAALLEEVNRELATILSTSEKDFYAPAIHCSTDYSEDDDIIGESEEIEDDNELNDLHGETAEDIELIRRALADQEEREKSSEKKKKKKKRKFMSANNIMKSDAFLPVASPSEDEKAQSPPANNNNYSQFEQVQDDSDREASHSNISKSSSSSSSSSSNSSSSSSSTDKDNDNDSFSGGSESYRCSSESEDDVYDFDRTDINDLPRRHDIELLIESAIERGEQPPPQPREEVWKPPRRQPKLQPSAIPIPHQHEDDNSLTPEQLREKYDAMAQAENAVDEEFEQESEKLRKLKNEGTISEPHYVDDWHKIKLMGSDEAPRAYYTYKTSRVGELYQVAQIPKQFSREEERAEYEKKNELFDGSREVIAYLHRDIPQHYIIAKDNYFKQLEVCKEQERLDGVAKERAAILRAREEAQALAAARATGQAEVKIRFIQPKLSRPLSNLSSKKHIVIIGAGISGLSAAREALRLGFLVTVLEAKSKAGGRIQTQSINLPNNNQAYTAHFAQPHSIIAVDLGADILYNHLNNPLCQFINSSQNPAYPACNDTAIYSAGSKNCSFISGMNDRDVSYLHGLNDIVENLLEGVNIRFETAVSKILYSANRVTVRTMNSHSYECDGVIVATPPAVLLSESITFEPSLPQWKLDAVSSIQFLVSFWLF
jgi:hypothetical protein